jgi:hypothetical protein
VDDKPKYPWRLATNERYRDVVKHLMTLSSAALLLPGFLAREFLDIPKGESLKSVAGWSIYASWLALAFAIFSGTVFHYLSAKWVRLAWGRDSDILGVPVTHVGIEKALHITFWLTAVAFIFGLAFAVAFLFGYGKRS